MSQPRKVQIDEKDRRRALRSLQGVWRELVSQLVSTCVENEEDLQQAGFSFSYQEIEDRFGQRLFLAMQMMQAVQQAGPPRPRPAPAYRVLRVSGPLEELDRHINERLSAYRGAQVCDVSLASDDDETWHAFVTLALSGSLSD